MVTARRMAIATTMGIRTLMADVFRVFFEGVIPALSGDPLICREAELEITKLRQADRRVGPSTEAGMTSVAMPGEGALA
jgi:hypothetical protein